MPEVRIKSLYLTNFKGIKHLEIDSFGDTTDIFGDNATGKTTVFDAVTFLLFGKDSLNATQFDILPVNDTGVEAEVQASILIDGSTQVVLRKTYAEKWTKKKGSTAKELTGHEINHFIDGVPVKKGDYDERIKSICDEEMFRLLSQPLYFNNDKTFPWKKRREMLFSACGDITEEQVYEARPELNALPKILGNLSTDQYRKQAKARQAELNKVIDQAPVRIAELQRQQAEADIVQNEADHRTTRDAFASEVEKLRSELTRLEEGGQAADLQKQIDTIYSEIMKLERADGTANDKAREKIDEQNRNRRAKIAELEYQRDSIDRQNLDRAQQVVELEKSRQRKLEEWNTVKGKEFSGNTTCPTCSQPLPEDQISKARSAFNGDKAGRLEEISGEGKRIAEKIKTLQTPLVFDKDADLQALIDAGEAQYPEAVVNPEIAKLEAQRAKLETKRDGLSDKAKTKARVDEINAEIVRLNERIKETDELLARIAVLKQTNKRIEELRSEAKVCAQEYEKLEGELALIDLFIRTKAEMVTDAINSKFQLVKFKLFEELLNGGIDEVCEATVDGVPYSSLNSGMRTNAGLDIINTLSGIYGVKVFQFIDNAESVTELHPTDSQRIRLIVSETDTKLRIEKGK